MLAVAIMARPLKHTVEYFSHDADASESKTLSILYNHFGHEGLSAWWLLLEQIAKTRNHIISIRNPEDIEFMAAKLHFKPDRLMEILSKMAELETIDPELFKTGAIWCQHFVDRQEQVYKSRGQTLPTKPFPVDIITAVGKLEKGTETALSGKETALSGKETALLIPENTHTKETILKRLKEYNADSSEFLLSLRLKTKILENNPRARVPADLQGWCQEFHILLGKNGYQPAEVEAVIDYCQADTFWKTNIMGAQKLRLQFDKLFLQAKEKRNGGQNGAGAGANRSNPKAILRAGQFTKPEDYGR